MRLPLASKCSLNLQKPELILDIPAPCCSSVIFAISICFLLLNIQSPGFISHLLLSFHPFFISSYAALLGLECPAHGGTKLPPSRLPCLPRLEHIDSELDKC